MPIYKIVNQVNSKVYIGQTTQRPGTRWNQHISALEKGTHVNEHLQRSWKKYGRDAWVFSVIDTAMNDLDLLETKYIKVFNSMDGNFGYNMREGQSGEISSEVKDKMSRAKLGIKLTDSHKENIRSSMIGKNKGKPKSQDAGRRLSYDLNKLDELIGDGLTLNAITQLLGVSRKAIHKTMKYHWNMNYKQRKVYHEQLRSKNTSYRHP